MSVKNDELCPKMMVSFETRQKMSASAKTAQARPDVKMKMSAARKAAKAKMSAAQKKRFEGDEARTQTSAATRAAMMNPVTRAKLRAAWELRKLRAISPDTRARMAAASRVSWERGGAERRAAQSALTLVNLNIAKTSSKRLAALRSPETRAKLSAAGKALFDPEFRVRRASHMTMLWECEWGDAQRQRMQDTAVRGFVSTMEQRGFQVLNIGPSAACRLHSAMITLRCPQCAEDVTYCWRHCTSSLLVSCSSCLPPKIQKQVFLQREMAKFSLTLIEHAASRAKVNT